MRLRTEKYLDEGCVFSALGDSLEHPTPSPSHRIHYTSREQISAREISYGIMRAAVLQLVGSVVRVPGTR